VETQVWRELAASARPGASSPGAFFGWSVAGGDLDGDGHGDVLVGAPGAGASRGSVHVYRGPSLREVARVEGEQDGESFGWSIAVGDDEVAVAAPGRDRVWRQSDLRQGLDRALGAYARGDDPRRAWALAWVSGAWLSAGHGWATLAAAGAAPEAWSWTSEPTDRVAVGGGGDVDGDCAPDFAIGVDRGPARAGRVELHSRREPSGSPARAIDSPDGDAGTFGAAVAISGPAARAECSPPVRNP
jgi:hypothetical protein